MLIIAVTSSGQDRSRLENVWQRLGIDPDTITTFEVVNRHIEGKSLGFDVAFDFSELPAPLKSARAILTLTAVDIRGVAGTDWQLGFDASERQITWLSDKFFDIPGQIEKGDVFTVPIEFMVLESGQFGFSMYWRNRSLLWGQVHIEWCISKDGELTFLGNTALRAPFCDTKRTTFFDQDSVRAIYKTHGEEGHDVFTGDCKIEPPFKIGEPSSVCFRIKFVEDHPDGVDMEISYGHMEVSDYPEALNGPLYAGDSVELCVTVVPLPIREKHDIALSVYDANMTPRKGVMKFTCIFSDNGSLRYIQLGNLSLGDKEDEFLPKSFPKGTKATCGSHWIRRN